MLRVQNQILWHIFWIVVVSLAMTFTTLPAWSQTNGRNGDGEVLIPGIWVDPDGCEHWVMDDGFEGYMSPVILPGGLPVCGRQPGEDACGLLQGDQSFATGSAILSDDARRQLVAFFRAHKARSYWIDGHTDARGTVAYNMRLSQARARAVAAVAREVGANVEKVRAFGEGRPRAPNDSPMHLALNRRVEIICLR